MKISVQIESGAWRRAWPRALSETRQTIRMAAATGWPSPETRSGFDIVCVLSDDSHVRALNKQFRSKDKPTNVLAFPDPAAPPGGVILSLETLTREAAAHGKPLVHHAKHLIVHGILHLAGYDHQTVKERRLMERLETAILGAMHIPNPYSIAAGRP